MPVPGASRKTALSALPPAPKNLGPGLGTSEVPPRQVQGWTLTCWTACHREAAIPPPGAGAASPATGHHERGDVRAAELGGWQ